MTRGCPIEWPGQWHCNEVEHAAVEDDARGGTWIGDAGIARVSVRFGWVANDRSNNIGFRIARSGQTTRRLPSEMIRWAKGGSA